MRHSVGIFSTLLLIYIIALANAIHQPAHYENFVVLGVASTLIGCLFISSCILQYADIGEEQLLKPVFAGYTSVPLSDEF